MIHLHWWLPLVGYSHARYLHWWLSLVGYRHARHLHWRLSLVGYRHARHLHWWLSLVGYRHASFFQRRLHYLNTTSSVRSVTWNEGIKIWIFLLVIQSHDFNVLYMLKMLIRNKMGLWNTDAPSDNKVKISMSYILTLPQLKRRVMLMECEKPFDELTVKAWLLYRNPNFKYCTSYVGGTVGYTDRRPDY